MYINVIFFEDDLNFLMTTEIKTFHLRMQYINYILHNVCLLYFFKLAELLIYLQYHSN